MNTKTRLRYELAGWILFTLSAIAFTVSSYRSGDTLALAASLFFLIACFVFIYAHIAPRPE
jgi:hypothetical protein